MLFHLVTSVLESGIKSFGIKTKKIRKCRQFPKKRKRYDPDEKLLIS